MTTTRQARGFTLTECAALLAIAALSPAEIATSILAEVIAVLRGGRILDATA